MGKWMLALLPIGCAGASTPHAETAPSSVAPSKLVAAYDTSTQPAVRARVVCATVDDAPKRWSDVVVRGDAKIEACEMIVRGECKGGGDVVRACSTAPLPAPLVPRGVVVLRHEMPESIRFETFANVEDCEAAARERPRDERRAWLDAQIAVETRELADVTASVKVAERRLADARAAQKPEISLLQLEVENLRRKRAFAEKALSGLRGQRDEADRDGAMIACVAVGRS